MSTKRSPRNGAPKLEPEAPRAAGVNYETGEMHGDRSRTDFAGSSSRKRARRESDPELGTGGDRRRTVREMQAGWAARGGGSR